MAKDKYIHPTRIFKTPEDVLKAWNEYKADLKERAKSWEKIQYVGKDGSRRVDHPKLPLILSGFEVFCYDNYGCVEQYFKNQDGYYNDFIPICTRIRTECRADQTTGGLLNMYNSSITQRLNNMNESIKHSGEIKGNDKEITVNICKSDS